MICKRLIPAATAALLTILVAMLAGPADGAERSYTLVAVGDIMLGTNYPSDNLPADSSKTLAAAAPLIAAATIATGNLEGVMLDAGGTVKTCANPSSCHVFRMPERYAGLLSAAGIDHVSMANNHSGDFGPAGRSATIRNLKSSGVSSTGLVGVNESAVVVRDGIRYGFASFSVSSGTLKATDYKKAREVVGSLQTDSACSIIVVNMHVGAEGAGHSRVTRSREMYLGEDRGNPYEFARVVIDAGADIVIGHGPHVARAVDLYKGRFIAYSLGNFATATGVSISGKSGYAPLVQVETDKEGKFLGGRIHSFIQSGANGSRRPVVDSTCAPIREIRRLTVEDGVGVGMSIGEDGRIGVQR